MHTPDDDLLMARLDRMLERIEGGGIEQAIILGEAAYDWRTLDAELAELVADSAELAGAVRAAGQPRLISFAGGAISLEVEVQDRRITGRIIPPTAAEVTVHSAEGQPASTHADDHGVFDLEGVPAGAVSFLVRATGQPALLTPWLIL